MGEEDLRTKVKTLKGLVRQLFFCPCLLCEPLFVSFPAPSLGEGGSQSPAITRIALKCPELCRYQSMTSDLSFTQLKCALRPDRLINTDVKPLMFGIVSPKTATLQGSW